MKNLIFSIILLLVTSCVPNNQPDWNPPYKYSTDSTKTIIDQASDTLTLGEHMKWWRLKQNLSVAEVAECANLPEYIIVDMEGDSLFTDEYTLAKISCCVFKEKHGRNCPPDIKNFR